MPVTKYINYKIILLLLGIVFLSFSEKANAQGATPANEPIDPISCFPAIYDGTKCVECTGDCDEERKKICGGSGSILTDEECENIYNDRCSNGNGGTLDISMCQLKRIEDIKNTTTTKNTATTTAGGAVSGGIPSTVNLPGCEGVETGGNAFGVAGAILCCILKLLTGPIGSAIATFAIVFAGFAGVTGKMAWQQVFVVAFAVFAIFAAQNIVEAVASIAGLDNVKLC